MSFIVAEPRYPPGPLDADQSDWIANRASFTNSQGGHIIVGREVGWQCWYFRIVGPARQVDVEEIAANVVL